MLKMKPKSKSMVAAMTLTLLLAGCGRQAEAPQAFATPTPAKVSAPEVAVPITLPVLNALFADPAFKSELKSQLQLSNDQIDGLRRVSAEAVTKLRQSNAENQSGSAEAARQSAFDAIRGVIGPD